MHSITQIEKKVNRKTQKNISFLCWSGIRLMTFGGTHGGDVMALLCKLMKQEHRRK